MVIGPREKVIEINEKSTHKSLLLGHRWNSKKCLMQVNFRKVTSFFMALNVYTKNDETIFTNSKHLCLSRS